MRQFLNAAQQQVALFNVMKKELLAARTFASRHREQLSAHDEMTMTCSRLQLMDESNQPESKIRRLGLVHESDVNALFARLEHDRQTAAAGLRDRLSSLHFLSSQLNSIDGNDIVRDTCIICQHRRLSKELEIAVLACFHRFCSPCILRLIHLAGKATFTISCPICRKVQPHKEISYVCKNKYQLPAEQVADSVEADIAASVKGSWSTKIGSLASLCLSIVAQEPRAKMLVFSEWLDCLVLVAHCLAENGIPNLTLVKKREYESIIHRFNTDPTLKCLLMPTTRSNHGLNLTIASHVILVEPSTSAAIEAQSIARVYRIGQTRQTKVHRLLIDGSVESMLAAKNQSQLVHSDQGFKGRGKQAHGQLTHEEMQRLIYAAHNQASNDGTSDEADQEMVAADAESNSDVANNAYWERDRQFLGSFDGPIERIDNSRSATEPPARAARILVERTCSNKRGSRAAIGRRLVLARQVREQISVEKTHRAGMNDCTSHVS